MSAQVLGIPPTAYLTPDNYVRASISGNVWLAPPQDIFQKWWDALVASGLGRPLTPRPAAGDFFTLSGPGQAVIDLRVTTSSLTAEQFADELDHLQWAVDLTRLELVPASHAGNPNEVESQRQKDVQAASSSSFWDKLGKVGQYIVIVVALLAVIVVVPRILPVRGGS